jgi:hypothetical protein
LKTQIGDRTATQVEICDGANLWSYRQIGDETRLSRLDVKRVREVQKQLASSPVTTPLNEFAFGGLPKLLDQLLGNFQPLAAAAGYLGEVPLWAVEAEWKPAVLGAIAPGQNQRIAAGNPFQFAKFPQLPERVMIYLGHTDLFPRRIEFFRRQGSAEQGRAGGYVSVVTLEFSDLQFGHPIDPRQFDYQPGIAMEDVTDAFLQSRGLTQSK